MKRAMAAGLACIGAANCVSAGGIDRSGQPLDLLFKDGNYAEVSVSLTTPDVTGSDLAQSPPNFPTNYDSGTSYDNVGGAFHSYGFGLKYDLSERVSFAVIGAEDYGSDISYADEPGSLLGGTEALADSYALTLVGRFQIDENFSVHAGVRADRADGSISLGGLAYGGPTLALGGTIQSADDIAALTGGASKSNAVSGYNVELGSDVAYGYLVGAAYEIPEIALRFAVTYYSSITHNFDTTEFFETDANNDQVADGSQSFSGGKTKVETPQAVNVEFQTGIAKDTLVFGSFRWADWSEFKIEPKNFKEATGTGLVNIDDSYTYELGLARRFNDQWAGSVAYILEPERSDDLVSPLSPTNGLQAIALGASYRATEQLEISAGMRYTWLGDARPETGTPDKARADFEDNSAVSFGVRVGYYF